jgi:hypothetical protein
MPSLNIIRRLWCGQQLTNIQTETNKHSSHLLVFTVRPVSLCWLDISVSSGYTAPKSVYYRTLCKSNMGFVCHRRSMLIKKANKIRAAKIVHETGQVYIPIFPVWYDARGFRGGGGGRIRFAEMLNTGWSEMRGDTETLSMILLWGYVMTRSIVRPIMWVTSLTWWVECGMNQVRFMADDNTLTG